MIRVSLFHAPKTQSAFHPRERQEAFHRRDARQMSFPDGGVCCFKRKGTDSGHVVAALIHKHRPG